jgi:hypothetical protein
LGAFLGRFAAQKPGFPLQFLGFAYANPVGFSLQSLAQWQLKNQSVKLPVAISQAHNCCAIMRTERGGRNCACAKLRGLPPST